MSPSVVIADRNEQTAATRKKVRENVTPPGWLSNAPSTVLGEQLDQSRTLPMATPPSDETRSLGETGHDGRPLIECYGHHTKRSRIAYSIQVVRSHCCDSALPRSPLVRVPISSRSNRRKVLSLI